MLKYWLGILIYTILVKFYGKCHLQLLSSHLVTKILYTEYFYIFKKISAMHSFTEEIGRRGFLHTEVHDGITLLYTKKC